MHPFISGQLAADRRAQLHKEAATARLAAAARASNDRTAADRLQIRPLDPTDIDEIAALFIRLSERSRYLRYMAPMRTLPAKMLSCLAAVDHQRHEAVGAFDDDQLVGAVHYFQSADDPTRADIAAEVSDRYQRQGVGSRLLRALGWLARERGITYFDSRVLAENTAAVSMLCRSGWRTTVTSDGPELAIAVAIPATNV